MITLKRTYGLEDELARFAEGDYVIFKTREDLEETPYARRLFFSAPDSEQSYGPRTEFDLCDDWDIVSSKMYKTLGGKLARVEEVCDDGEILLDFETEELNDFADGYTIQTWMVKHPFGEGNDLDLWYTPWKRTKLRSIVLSNLQKKALGEERIRALKSNAEFLCDRVLLQLMGKELDNPIEKKSGVVRVFCPELGEEYETLLDFLRPLPIEDMNEVEIPDEFYDKYKDVLFSEWEAYQDRKIEADSDDGEDDEEEEAETVTKVNTQLPTSLEDTKDRSVCAFLRVGDRVRVRDNYPADWKFEGGVKGLHCNLETLKLLYSGFDAIVEEVFADGVSLSFRDSGRELERLTWKAKQGGLVFPFWCLEFRD